MLIILFYVFICLYSITVVPKDKNYKKSCNTEVIDNSHWHYRNKSNTYLYVKAHEQTDSTHTDPERANIS